MKKHITINKRNHFLIICLSSLFFLAGSELKAQTMNKVLFLGNSHTYLNNMPQMTADLAITTGDTIIFDMYAPGGYNLIDHAGSTIAQAKMQQQNWDYVVIQEQQQYPSSFETLFYKGAGLLVDYMDEHSSCALPLFYMTWARENGDPHNCWTPTDLVCTYEGMDDITRQSYINVASINKSLISPVGVVWRYIKENHPSIELFQPDGSHATLSGSFIAACCFYTTILKKNPLLTSGNFGIPANDAQIIRNATKLLVYDSLGNWNFLAPNPLSSFSYHTGDGNNEVIFKNNSTNADSYLWDFGDGNTSANENPTHNYSANGTYLVSLTAFDCQLDTVFSNSTQQTLSFCQHTPSFYPDSLIRCPQSNDTIWTDIADSYQWFNSQGNLLLNDTNQYYIVSDNSFAQTGDPLNVSVLVTKNGCSELSKKNSKVITRQWDMSWSTGVNIEGAAYTLTQMNPIIEDVCIGDTVKLSFSNPPSQDMIIQWYNGTNPIASNNDTLIVLTSGSYNWTKNHTICSSMNSGQSSWDRYNINFKTCSTNIIENDIRDSFWSIAPNPATEVLTIKYERAIIKEQIQIYNAIGQLVKEKEASEITIINISDLPNGVYFIRLKNNKQPALKFIKQ